MAIKAIDISAWQGEVSEKVFSKNKGAIPYIVIRSSYTKMDSFRMYEDKAFEENFLAAYKAGLVVGAYHYSQAISESESLEEAKFAINVIRKYEKKYGIKIVLFIAFDWEFGQRLSMSRAKKLGKQRCKQICDSFCRYVRANNYVPAVYANLSTFNGYIESDIWKYWNIWVAQYHTRCDYKHRHLMWQYSSSGKVSGISGRIDMDWYYPGEEASDSEKPKEETYKGQLPKLPRRGWFTSGDGGKKSSVKKSEVIKLQKFLNWYGQYGLDEDGEVGRLTMNAVRQYEGREKLKPVDGLFGSICLERAKVVKR